MSQQPPADTAQSILRVFEPLSRTLENPVALGFLGLAAFFVIRSFVASFSKGPEQFSMKSVQQTSVPAQRDFTPRELSAYDGKDEGTALYIAVKGIVYDVSKSRGFYGPGGAYANFSGRDASRGLAMSSFGTEMLADLDGPIDALDDLDNTEMDSLDEWAGFFAGKYVPVGRLVNPPEVAAAAAAVAASESKKEA
ncbi:Dihydrodipicolinate synthase [Coemansia erecta]|uniref:Dihydrodipicolinate synthase n=1 Tax=Coemansia asiatica TaxID=1052880 RepID=A0A9W7XPV4_9FUNG|nr:Dihydrodipicolinate synthase [Coemansia asiatica]KAJ2858228.1 Dihydrodipicolinate synthase [Coemansia erecta]KAJ2888747.1 Dihydrodipicolinate synthase [Coemansia asiatica]